MVFNVSLLNCSLNDRANNGFVCNINEVLLLLLLLSSPVALQTGSNFSHLYLLYNNIVIHCTFAMMVSFTWFIATTLPEVFSNITT